MQLHAEIEVLLYITRILHCFDLNVFRCQSSTVGHSRRQASEVKMPAGHQQQQQRSRRPDKQKLKIAANLDHESAVSKTSTDFDRHVDHLVNRVCLFLI